MKLRDWMREHKHNAAWVALQVKASEATVSRWLNGKTEPSVKNINAIHRLTGGEVTSFDWEDAAEDDNDGADKRAA